MDSNIVMDFLRLYIRDNIPRVQPALLEPETYLDNRGLGLDSIEVLMIIIAVEDHFGVRFDPDNGVLQSMDSAGKIADFVAGMKEQ